MKQRPRRVGLGMKPREVSADVVQPEVPKEAVSEVVVGEPEGGYLDLKAEPVIDSEFAEVGEEVEKEATVAEMSVFERPTILSEKLDALLEQSKVVTGVEIAQPFSGDGEGKPVLVTRENGKIVGFQPEVDSINEAAQTFGDAFFAAGHAQSKVAAKAFTFLGQLPNGDTRTTVLVREGIWEGVVSQAEADHLSIEEWLTNELAQRLEDTFYGRH